VPQEVPGDDDNGSAPSSVALHQNRRSFANKGFPGIDRRVEKSKVIAGAIVQPYDLDALQTNACGFCLRERAIQLSAEAMDSFLRSSVSLASR
jgi:hypothetical protein